MEDGQVLHEQWPGQGTAWEPTSRPVGPRQDLEGIQQWNIAAMTHVNQGTCGDSRCPASSKAQAYMKNHALAHTCKALAPHVRTTSW